MNYIPLFFLIIFTSCAQSKIVCNQFKIGDFELCDKKQDFCYKIQRSEHFQIEENLQTGNQSKYHIKWTSDCSYNLRLISRNGKNVRPDLPQIIVEIEEINGDGYFFSARFSGEDQKDYQFMRKMSRVR